MPGLGHLPASHRQRRFRRFVPCGADAGSLDEGPPFLDLSLLKRSERLQGLRRGRRNGLTQFRQALSHRRIGQGVDDGGIQPWFDAACDVAGVSPRTFLESSAPHTLMALASIGYGVAVLPSNVPIVPNAVRGVALVRPI